MTALTVKRLETGWYHVRGYGPCEWAQPPYWPCSEEMLREYAFAHASETFIRNALTHMAEHHRSGG